MLLNVKIILPTLITITYFLYIKQSINKRYPAQNKNVGKTGYIAPKLTVCGKGVQN